MSETQGGLQEHEDEPHATMSMAEFEARGLDVLAWIAERYRLRALPYEVPKLPSTDPASRYRPDGDVGVFSVERHEAMPGFAKYGFLMEVPRMLTHWEGDGIRTPVQGHELPSAPFELRAAYAACHVLEKMIIAEAKRLESRQKGGAGVLVELGADDSDDRVSRLDHS